MTEQDVMKRLAEANPVPDGEFDGSSSRAQFLLRSVLARPRPRRRVVRWALVPAGLAAAVAAGVVVVTVDRPAPPPPVPTAATPQTILSAAAEQAVRAAPKGEFVHVTGTVGRVVHRTSAGGYDLIRVDQVQSMHPANGQPGEGWLTIGETGSSVRPLTAADAAAYRRDGSPGPAEVDAGSRTLYPNLTGDHSFAGDVATLPDDPAQAGAAMLAAAPGVPDPTGWLFREGTKLLDTFTEVIGGAGQAKVYRMLGGLAGVRTLDTTTDPLGRPATGLAYTGPAARYGTVEWQIFLGPGTGQIMFSQAVVRQPGPANAGLRPGAVQFSTAVTSVTWSDKP